MALMTKKQRELFFKRLNESYPEPRCELNWKTPFSLLVAIILSAQSTDKSVNKVTDTLFQVATTPAQMIALGEAGLKQHIRSINYFNNKAKSIMGLAHVLQEKYDSVVPNDFDMLLTLPGVGRKTANVFLNIAFHAPFIGVDTHVFRSCHRLKICTGKTPADVEAKLTQIVPDWYKPDVALALVLHGRYICTAKRPKCGECPLTDVCLADEKNTAVSTKGQ